MATVNAWWGDAEAEFSSPALTVRAQALPLDNSGELVWDAFFGTRDSNTRVVKDIIKKQGIRYTADRREYNVRGRLIPLDTVGSELMTITPIESYFKIEEEEIIEYREIADGNEARFLSLIGASIPDRIDSLVMANNRRIELDVFRAWSTGIITTRNPQLGHISQTFSYGIDASRYMTAGTAWDATTAYANFMAWIATVEKLPGFGRMAGAVMRRATFDLIQAAASSTISTGLVPIMQLTPDQLRARVRAELGRDFQFIILENTLEEFQDGGTTNRLEVELVPDHTILAVPQTGTPGTVVFAPTFRGYEVANVAPEAKINRNRHTVYVETAGNGREVTFECQITAMPFLVEEKIAVIDHGAYPV